jgi:hypothetical protein
MKKIKITAGLIAIMVLFSNLLMADTDRTLVIKRWKVVKHQKSNKNVPVTEDDFLQFRNDGVYEHVRNHYYAKGSWALNADELTINNNGEFNWKIVSVSETKMTVALNDEIMEMEVVKMPAPTAPTMSQNVKYLCLGKWRPTEHHKGDAAIKFPLTDMITFFPDGTFEQILNGVYSKGNWNYNKEETEITIAGTVWKVDGLSSLFFKLIKMPDTKEFMVFAKTR